MTSDSVAEARLSGKKSLRLLFTLLAVTLSVAFVGELVILLVLSRLLSANVSEWGRALLAAGLLAALLTVVVLPLMLHFRRRNLRVGRRALRLQFALDQHAIVSITDGSGRITFANERFCQISGYTLQELIGQNHRILKSGIHPAEFFEIMWRTIARGSTWHGEVCNRNKTGGLYWVHATIAPFLDDHGKPEEYIAIRTEITAQKELEKVFRQREAWLRTILDNLGEGVYTLDASGKLNYLNAEAERLIGWRMDELAGKGLHDIIHHHRADGRPLPAAECPIHLAMRDRRIYRSADEVFFHRDGTPLPVKITGAPLALEGEWQGSVAVFSDMREQSLLSRRLLEAKEAGMRIIREQQVLRREYEELRRRLLELSIANQRAQEAALTDVLTGLYNRRYAMERLAQEWAEAERGNRPLSVLMLDIDHFKEVNDNQGHDAGDAVLRQFAGIMRGFSRAPDVTCRFGGEEFLLIATDTGLQGARLLAERVRCAVERKSLVIPGGSTHLTVSIGVAEKSAAHARLDDLVKAADDALYRAKQHGRNRVEVAP